VYNVRIAETKKKHFEESAKPYTIFGITFPMEQFRKKYYGETQLYNVIYSNLIHVRDPFYARIDFAASKFSVKFEDFRFSRTQMDDLLFMGGYSFEPNKKSKLTLSGLLGIPLHADHSALEPQFGIGQVGLGSQLSGGFIYLNEYPHNTIRLIARYIHFFPRKNNFETNQYKFSSGNLIDLLITFHFDGPVNRFETGYNTEFDFGAHVTPDVPNLIKRNSYIRHSFYAGYKRKFLLKNYNASVATALSYSFDQKPKILGNKYIITTWTTWGISF